MRTAVKSVGFRTKRGAYRSFLALDFFHNGKRFLIPYKAFTEISGREPSETTMFDFFSTLTGVEKTNAEIAHPCTKSPLFTAVVSVNWKASPVEL